MILIPVKNLKHAKQRLAALFDRSTRTELAEAMLADVAETLNSWPHRPAVGLVTHDSFAIELARKFNFEVIADGDAKSETEAIEIATRYCEQREAKFTLVIPGDIPLIKVSELDLIIQFAPEEGSVLVPSFDKRGTNAALRRPCGLFPLRFGNDSFAPHLAAAQATGKPGVVLSLPGIALDIDSPWDLQQLSAAPGQSRSQRLARQWNLDPLPAAASDQ
jgi:2-phospho-L-lactate/phosphoenolpyruvate guanylyltransferase